MKKKRIVVFELSEDGICGHIISLKEALKKYEGILSVNAENESWCFRKEFKMIGETLADSAEGIIGVYDCTKIEQLNRMFNWNKKMSSKVEA